MKLLCWDTSSKSGALAALEFDPRSSAPHQGLRLVSEWTLNVDAQHSDRLLWSVHQLLEASRWKLDEVDLFAVGVGPGSFTGLRIGMTTARTLAHAKNKPLIGISSLAALARPAAAWGASIPKSKVVVVATTDACKGELFSLYGNARAVTDCVAMNDGDAPGLWKRGVEERVLTPPDLMKALKKRLSETEGSRWLAVGEGRARYPEAWKLLPTTREIEAPVPFSQQVQGRYVGLLAWEAFQAGIQRPALQVHPRYVRASDAELKLRAGLLPPGPTRG